MTETPNEQERLLAEDVASIGRIGAIEKILDVACRVTHASFATVARVTPNRWIAGAVRDEMGLGLTQGSEIPIHATLCDDVLRNNALVVIDQVSKNIDYCKHPTLVDMKIESYISVPIVLPDGEFFGTLCAMDRSPNRLASPEIVGMFTLFADLIAQHLDTQIRLARSEKALLSERETAELREEFIAVLGHDLRNPLAAIRVMASELDDPHHNTEAQEIGSMILDCTQRMNSMIADVLDLARGRLGDGLGFSLVRTDDLEHVLMHVVEEIKVAHKDRIIHQDISLTVPLYVDTTRMCQLISNLIANAITHGERDSPVWIRVNDVDEVFTVEVDNQGLPIADDVASRLFQPFQRSVMQKKCDGLGLGLYIASEIARGHGGTLEFTQSNGMISFIFNMPITVATLEPMI